MAEQGLPPTFREIQKQLGYSSLGTVYSHIRKLKELQLLHPGKHVRIGLTSPLQPQPAASSMPLKLDIIGNLSAGFPLEMAREPEGYLIPPQLVNQPQASYLLRVKGDTLIEESLLDGDILIIEARGDPKDGDLIVGLLLESGVIVKHYFQEDPFIRLENSTRRYEPLILHAEELEILGIVQGVIRKTAV
jgi:repressor LexA